MTGDERADILFYALAAILPISALAARRLPLRRTALLILIWATIFGGAALAVAFGRGAFGETWNRWETRLSGDTQRIDGGTLRVRMAEDGHFWAVARINGVERRMLIDSGATTTALSAATARAAGLDTAADAFPTILDTANGRVAAESARVDALSLGPIVARNLKVVVSPAFGETDVIGMNFLSRLGGWRVEGKTLILTATTPNQS